MSDFVSGKDASDFVSDSVDVAVDDSFVLDDVHSDSGSAYRDVDGMDSDVEESDFDMEAEIAKLLEDRRKHTEQKKKSVAKAKKVSVVCTDEE